jgi:hypothetical protein
MQQKLNTEAGRDLYRMRKAIVEPVFGQIKEWRGFRRFLPRGLHKVRAEWKLICLTHNLLKLFRSGQAWQMSLRKHEEQPCLGCEKGSCEFPKATNEVPRFQLPILSLLNAPRRTRSRC